MGTVAMGMVVGPMYALGGNSMAGVLVVGSVFFVVLSPIVVPLFTVGKVLYKWGQT